MSTTAPLPHDSMLSGGPSVNDARIGWVEFQARRVPHKTALIDVETDRHVTYAELQGRIGLLAGHLAALGVDTGDRVAVLSNSCAHVFELLYACANIGAVMVPLNWRLTPTELGAIADDCEPRILFHDADNAATALTLAQDRPRRLVQWGGDDDRYEAAIAGSTVRSPIAGLPDHQPWIIVYTSGTTGLPKGAVHTFRSVRANLDNSAYACEIDSDTVALNALPTFHVAGLHLYANSALMHGGTVLIMRKFDPADALRMLADPARGITHFGAVPAMFQYMASRSDFDSREFTGIKATVGGSPVPAPLVDTWQHKGMEMMPIYGATEAGSSLLFMPPDRWSRAAHTAPQQHSVASGVGVPVVHAEATIRDPSGEDVGPDVVGELWVRGPMLMEGYWRNATETARAIDKDGWFHTGDAAKVNAAGIYSIVDRWKDMFISGGENVYPAEVENVLYQHPAVVLASVIGVPDARWGEVGRAFVVRTVDDLDGETLLSWCRDRLASYKVPSEIVFRIDLPRNATGKIMKTELRGSSVF